MHLLHNPRRSHKKSRYGCAECKRRHVKCDEQRPICGRCQIRGQECTYIALAQKAASDRQARDNLTSASPCTAGKNNSNNQRAKHQSESDPEKTCNQAPNHHPFTSGTKGRLHEMQLFHHVLMVTAPATANDALELRFWQMEIPQIALSHEFVMEGLLAVAALHLAHLEPVRRDEWARIALTHQLPATTGLREYLNSGLGDSLEAKFAASAIILLLVTAYPGVCGDSDTEHKKAEHEYSLNTVQSIRSALEGCALLFSQIYHSRQKSSIDYWLRRERPSRLKASASDGQYSEISTKLHSVKDLIEKSHIESSLFGTYHRALSLNLDLVDSWPEKQETFIWPLYIGNSFLDLCRQGDLIAQILLMFYGMTLHLDSGKWYILNAGKQLVSSVLRHMGADREIPSEWKEIVHWTRHFVDMY